MRKVFLAFALCLSASAFAQVLNVTSVEKVNIPANPAAKVAAISPQGDYLLLTTDVNKGLTKFDLATNAQTTLTDALGAGYDVKISQDGQNVVYREKSFGTNKLSHTSLNVVNVASGAKRQLVAATRNLQGVAVEQATVAAINGGRMSAKALGAGKAQVTVPVLSINNRNLMITRGNKAKKFNPNGDQLSYLWPSVSPDGTKALYYVAGQGTFVCNLDGTGLKHIGNFRAPKWYDNETVLGMNDEDDGELIYASTIVAANLAGQQQVLTDGSVIAMYPQASAASGKIAFSTPAGEAYIINVSK